MSALIWDSTAQAFKDADTPKIYSGSSFGDAEGKIWNETAQAWEDAWSGFDGVSLVPLMTSSTTPSGKVTCSTAQGGTSDNYAGYFAFAREVNKWWSWSPSNNSEWLEYEFEKPVEMSKFTLYPATHYGGATSSITFTASLGGNWITLGSVSFGNDAENNYRELSFTKAKYKYIRATTGASPNGGSIHDWRVLP